MSPRQEGRRVDLGVDEWLLRLGPDLRLHARRGQEITVDAREGVAVEELGAWVLGPATVAILYQRGLTPLHGSAVAIGDRVIAFLGPSGVGKSSLAAACVAVGAQFITDDVLVVTPKSGGVLVGFPGPPHLRLPLQTARRIGTAGLDPVGTTHDDKLLTRPDTAQSSAPVELGACFLLRTGGKVSTHRIRGLELLRELRRHLQRPGLVAPLGAEATIFETLGALTRNVPVWQLLRPEGGWSLTSCLALVEVTLEQHALSNMEP